MRVGSTKNWFENKRVDQKFTMLIKTCNPEYDIIVRQCKKYPALST